MVDTPGDKQDKFDEYGEEIGDYISLETARLLAIRHATDNQEIYGEQYARQELAWDVVGTSQGEDYYYVTLSWRPARRFRGEHGTEQYTIDLTGRIEHRQLLGEPSAKGMAIVPISGAVIGLVAIIAVAVAFASGVFAPSPNDASSASPLPAAVLPSATVGVSAGGTTNSSVPTATSVPVQVSGNASSRTLLLPGELVRGKISGLFYDGNTALEGTPHRQDEERTFIEFAWDGDAPVDGFGDVFSAKLGTIVETPKGECSIYHRSDDGRNLFWDEELIVESWTDQERDSIPSVHKMLVEAGEHSLIVDYYDAGGAAYLEVIWECVELPDDPKVASTSPQGSTPVPTTVPTNTPEATTAPTSVAVRKESESFLTLLPSPTPTPLVPNLISGVEIPDEWYLKVLPEDEDQHRDILNVVRGSVSYPSMILGPTGKVMIKWSGEPGRILGPRLAIYDESDETLTIDSDFVEKIKIGAPVDLGNRADFGSTELFLLGDRVGMRWSAGGTGGCFVSLTSDGTTWETHIVPYLIPAEMTLVGLPYRNIGSCFAKKFGLRNEVYSMATSGDNKNISLLTGEFGSESYSEVTDVRDSTEGQVVNGPHMLVSSSGKLLMAWGDSRRWSDGKKWDIYFTESSDNGATFGRNTRLNNEPMTGNGFFLDADESLEKILITEMTDRPGCNSDPIRRSVGGLRTHRPRTFYSQNGAETFAEFSTSTPALISPETFRFLSPLSSSQETYLNNERTLHSLFKSTALLWTKEQVTRPDGESIRLCRSFIYYTRSTDDSLQAFTDPIRLYDDQSSITRTPVGVVETESGKIIVSWIEKMTYQGPDPSSIFITVIDKSNTNE